MLLDPGGMGGAGLSGNTYRLRAMRFGRVSTFVMCAILGSSAAACGSSSRLSSPGSTTHPAGSSSNGSTGAATVTITLDRMAVPAGVPLTGEATVQNNTGKPIPEPDPACERWLVVSLDGHIDVSSGNSSAVLCNPIDHVPVGLSRYSITVQTTYPRCSQVPSQATSEVPACLGPNRNVMPPLPAGTYHTVLSVRVH
jgi:hypothetical protein